jgi:hypothetical protein
MQAEPDPALPDPGNSGSNDPVTMEETWARNAPYSFETWHSRVNSQQSENIVYITINPHI